MKKIAIFFFIIITIVVTIIYMYIDYQNKQNEAKKENKYYEDYLNKEINGLEVATIINKVIDKNNKLEVDKDERGYYIEDKNSIKIDLRMIDTDKIYKMEDIYNGGINKFTSYYGQIKFKCTQIEHHEESEKVKYMLFEQVTTY